MTLKRASPRVLEPEELTIVPQQGQGIGMLLLPLEEIPFNLCGIGRAGKAGVSGVLFLESLVSGPLLSRTTDGADGREVRILERRAIVAT